MVLFAIGATYNSLVAQGASPMLEARFVIGRLGAIEDVDDGACRLLGYSRAELLELHGSDLIAFGERPAVAVSLDRMRRGDIEWRYGRIVRKDGSVVAVEVHADQLPDDCLALRVRERAVDVR